MHLLTRIVSNHAPTANTCRSESVNSLSCRITFSFKKVIYVYAAKVGIFFFVRTYHKIKLDFFFLRLILTSSIYNKIYIIKYIYYKITRILFEISFSIWLNLSGKSWNWSWKNFVVEWVIRLKRNLEFLDNFN